MLLKTLHPHSSTPTRYKRYFLAHRCVINQCKYCFRTIAESDALNFARFTHTRFCNETLRHTSGISNAKSTSFSHNPTCWRKSVFGFRPLCFIIQFAVGNDVYSGGGLWFLCVVFSPHRLCGRLVPFAAKQHSHPHFVWVFNSIACV